jgi:hypothetical protein
VLRFLHSKREFDRSCKKRPKDTSDIQLKALKSRKAEELIEAVRSTIIVPFGIPKFFRCDNESAMANSSEFHKFMEPLGINFLPCSTASPWSNGAAERAVQTIKNAIRKFSQQENIENDWDEKLHFLLQLTTSQLQFMATHPNNFTLVLQIQRLQI